MVEAVSEIMDVMDYKAEELGVKLFKEFKFPKGELNELNVISNDEKIINIGFDSPRLQ